MLWKFQRQKAFFLLTDALILFEGKLSEHAEKKNKVYDQLYTSIVEFICI